MATAAEIQAELAAGPQTQDALDAALLKYSPAEMAAAFPQFGNVADFNNATREAYARVQQQEQEASRAAVRADMAARGEEIRISNPGEGVQVAARSRPTMSAIPQSEIDAARARLTPEQQQFIDWQISQVNSMTGEKIGDAYARQGVNPYANPAQAQAQIERATNREALFEQAGVQPGDLRPWSNTPPPSGGGRDGFGSNPTPNRNLRPTVPVTPSRDGFGFDPTPVTPVTPTTPARPRNVTTGDYTGANLNVSNFGRTPFTDDLFSYFKNQSPFYYQDRPDSVQRVAAIRDFYAANDGRTDPQAQSDLNRFLASGYTAREFNTALPQFAQSDLEKAIGAAYKEFPRSENSSNASPTAGAAQGLAALYASLNANLFDANSQNAQDTGNTSNTGIAGLS